MRLLAIFGIITFLTFLISANNVFALSLPGTSRPFGGKVLTTFAAGVVCRGIGPITITPAGFGAPFGPYVIDPIRTRAYKNMTVLTGSWILGKYSFIPSYTHCATTSPPPVPVPVFVIDFFGSSLPF